MLLSLDLFGAPAPTFNIRGETKVRTYFGAVLSTMIITVTLLFSLVKLEHLLSKHNPTVNTFEDKNVFGTADVYKPASSEEFMMAFAVTSEKDAWKVKHDPRFVKWLAYQRTVLNGEETYNEVPLHPCTEEEYTLFHEPEDDDTARLFELIK